MRHLLLPLAGATLLSSAAAAQQDSSFHAHVPRPAYVAAGPRVLVDEGHWNAFTTAEGRGRALQELLGADGYRVGVIAGRLTPAVLWDADVVVIAAARGLDWLTLKSNGGTVPDSAILAPAYTPDEARALHAWVQRGGGLVLAVDHFPYVRTMGVLATPFGVDLRDGYLADTAHLHRASLPDSFPAGTPLDGRVLASRANGLLAEHPITNGRDSTERVSEVVLFGGTSLCGPATSAVLVRLGDAAEQRTMGPFPASVPSRGCAQALALRVGRGRVVVLGDANGFVTAQERDLGTRRTKVGLSMSDVQNRQFVLNALHWVSGLIP